MARSLPRPTDVELQILDVFWQHGPITVRQAHNLILQTEGRCETSYSTTLKMIQVLHEKGFLSRSESVRPQVYSVVVSREETQKRLLQDLAQRLFGGAMTDLVQCAVSSPTVSEADLTQMQALIRKAKRGENR
jgi:BlaI family transcriptional regulator, penicillinase repressor